MRMTVNEVSSHLCKILILIIVKTYLQTGQKRYRIARCPVSRRISGHGRNYSQPYFSKEISQVIIAAMVLAANFY